jgi:ribonuclease HI
MGFRDYYDFNQALLAKQAWRLLAALESLCAKVLRARYFKEGKLLTAGCPKRASFTWRSIMHGRDLLKEGLIWRVGNGNDIDVRNQNWIPRSSLQWPMGFKPNQQVEKVSELLSPGGGGWDTDKLNEVFYQADVDDILKIPVGRAGSEDYVAWNYTKNGVFSVRSAYHLKRHLRAAATGMASSSRNVSEHQGWLSLWSANVPGKVKVHGWRVAKNALAVGEELKRRKIKDGVRCIVCNREETVFHRFWLCAHSIQVWETIKDLTGLGLQPPPRECQSPRALQRCLLQRFGQMVEQELAMYLMALYHMWLARNEARDELMIENPENTARRIVGLTEEWRALKQITTVQGNQVEEHWRPPQPGWHKVNSDGAFSKENNHGGGGVIVRDHHGAHIACASHFFPYVDDPERAELLACRKGVRLAKELGVSRINLEMDCAGAVSKLNHQELDRSAHGPLVEDIKLLLGEFEEVVVTHARRSCNGVAHRLAKEGCGNNLNEVWLGAPPEFVMNLVVSDVDV